MNGQISLKWKTKGKELTVTTKVSGQAEDGHAVTAGDGTPQSMVVAGPKVLNVSKSSLSQHTSDILKMLL